MKKASIRLIPVVALVLLAVAGAALRPQSANSNAPIGNKVLAHKLAVELGTEKARGKEMPISSGVMYAMLERTGVLNQRLANWARSHPRAAARMRAFGHEGHGLSRPNTEGCQNVFHGHGQTNTRVNQDCSFRRQAEEVIQLNPRDEDNIIAGQNDSRIGFNHCGYDWSFDGGKKWGDQIPPFFQFVLPDGHTADACSDPTATFDAQGNAYVGGVIFDAGSSNANAVVVTKSNAGIGGAFYHSPNPAGGFQTFRDNPLGVVANDNSACIFNDKEFIVADATAASPKANHVYATWTRFDAFATGCTDNSPIYFSQSTDGGATWSAGVEISGTNAAICTVANASPGKCDQDQGSHPIVGRDGTIYVAFGNGNTPLLGINQVLFVKCPASSNCALASSWSTPVKVDDLIGTHPSGVLPPNTYRVPEFTSISTSVDSTGKLYVVWADHRNSDANCLYTSVTPGPPCDHDVFYASSTNGGATWASHDITPRSNSRFGNTAQWQPHGEVTADGTRLWVAFYDRAATYGNCETTGCNDITSAEILNPASGSPTYKYARVTTGSMPNLTAANNPIQAGFLGDYMWLDTDSHNNAHIVWADTRPIRGTVPEEDIYYAKVGHDDEHGGH